MAGPYTTELDVLRNVTAGDLNTDQLNVAISSSALPSGAATSAKQDTGNTSLASIDTKTPAMGQATMANSSPVVIASNQTGLPIASTVNTTDTIATAILSSFQTLDINCTGAATVGIQLTASGSWTGGAVSLSGTVDGTTFTSTITVFDMNTSDIAGALDTSVVNHLLYAQVAGLKTLRATTNSLTGSIAITMRASQVPIITSQAGYSYVKQSTTPWVTGGALAQASTTSGQNGNLVLTATTTASPVYVTAKSNPLSTDTAGNLRVAFGTANQSCNVAQINGVTPLMGAGNTGTGSPRVTIATDQAILTNAWKSNTAQINGVTPLMGNGITGTGSQRVTIASDNTAFAVNATLQTGANTIGALTANQSVNVAQINGVTTLMNNGIAGTGSQRVVMASDNTINTNSYSTRADTYTTTASGTTVDISAKPMKNFSVLVKATGTVTSWDVRLEGSNDNSNFSQILAHTNVSPGDGLMVFTGSTLSPCLYFRSRCAGLVLGAGTNVVVTILGMT